MYCRNVAKQSYYFVSCIVEEEMLNKENTLDKSHLSAPCWRNTQKKRALEIPSSLRMTATLARTLSGPHEKNVEMIEAGQVANLIVKDASRLGREYLQVGYYMETLWTRAQKADRETGC